MQKNQQGLSYIDHADVAISVSQKDISFLIDSAVKQISNNPKIRIPHVSKYKIQDVSALCNSELINISAAFDVRLDTLGIKLAGQFSGVVGFTVSNDSLLLAPAFKTLHLDTAEYKKVKGFDAKIAAVFVSQLLKDFMDNLNGYIDSQLKGFDLKLIDKKLLDTGIVKNNHAHISSTKPLQISLPHLTGACLVDTGGIHVLGAFDNGSVTSKANAPATSTTFEEDFLTFQRAFTAREKLAFPLPPTGKTFFLIAKSSMASMLNGLLANSTVAGIYKDTLKVKPYDKEEIIYMSDIDCSKVNVNCPTRPMRPYNHCGGNLIQKGKCAIANVGIFNENTAIAALNLHIVAGCKIATTTTEGACSALKISIEAAAGHQVKLAKVHFDANAEGQVTASISNFNITNDLSKATLNIQCSAGMDAIVDYSIKTENEGKLICPFGIGTSIPDKLTGQFGSPSQSAKISITKGDGGRILLGLAISPIPFQIKTSNSPATVVYKALNSALNCTIPGIDKLSNFSSIMTSKFAEKFGDLLSHDNTEQAIRLIFAGQADTTSPQIAVDFSLNAKPVKLFNKSIGLTPIINDTYLGFSD